MNVNKYNKTRIRNAKRVVLQNMYFCGSSVTKGVTIEGYDTLKELLGVNLARTAEIQLKDDLRRQRRTWHVWVGIFSIEDGNNTVQPYLIDLPNLNSKEFDAELTAYIKDAADVAGDDAVGYAWFATPSDTIDLSAQQEQIIQMYTDLDIYNVEKRESVTMINKLEQTKRKKGINLKDTIRAAMSDIGGNEHVLAAQ